MGDDGYLGNWVKYSSPDAVSKRINIHFLSVHSIPQLRVKGKSIGPVLSFGENEPFNIYDAGD